MPTICPVTDIKTKHEEITDSIRTSREPVYLTENGTERFVLVNVDYWKEHEADYDIDKDPVIYAKLKQSEAEIKKPGFRYLAEEEVYGPIQKKIKDYMASHPEDDNYITSYPAFAKRTI